MPPEKIAGKDSNLRPLGYEPNELTTAPPRDKESMSLTRLSF